MNDEWHIREILESILESQCAPEEACAGYPELLPEVRRRLERMRRIESQIDDLFPTSDSGVAITSWPTPVSASLPQIEGYDVEGILGRGGMGVVYRARHLKLNRVVALKMLLAGPFAGPQEVARFVRESQAVAELQHSHIVQVYHVGDLDGRPYFTMEFLEGGTLAHQLAGTPQPSQRAAELTVILARAVQAAHTKGIIHRDLKPANILLSGDGTPKIADFGLARHIDGDPRLTMSGARVGTPSYMAPEQALGGGGTIGPAVDIYALGAILYEMLTGRPPFRAETALETERQVITVEAVPPSRLNTNVPRNLETICLKCLHKDSSRRYGSAAALADDLQRFLEGRPVHARSVGWLERVWQWGKRNQGVAAALSGIALLLVLIAVGSVVAATHFHKLEGEQRRLAQEKGILADQKGELVVEKERERAKAVEAEKRESGLRRLSEAQSQELRSNLYLSEMNLAMQAASVPSGLVRVNEYLARWEDEAPDLRNWEWYYLKGLCHRSLLTRIGHVQGVYHVAWNPSGTRLAAAGDQTICIWDPTNESPLLRLSSHDHHVLSVAWSPDGQRLASASRDHTVSVWDTNLGVKLLSFKGHTADVYSVAWSPDGNTIASGSQDLTIQLWDAMTGTVHQILSGHTDAITGLAWSPDSRRIVSGSRDSTLRVWDVGSREPMHTSSNHQNWVNQVAWSPDGLRLASASNDQTIRIWDAGNGQEVLKFRAHAQGVTSVAWSPDSTRLASSSDDKTVKVWLAATGTEVFALRGHTAPLTSIAWSPRGDRIASAAYDHTVKVWDASTGPETPILTGHETPVHALAWCQRDATRFASADTTGKIHIWDLPQRTVRRTLRGEEQAVEALAWHPAGTALAAGSGNGLIRLWDVATANEMAVLNGHQGMVYAVAWSPDGRRLASSGFDNKIYLWDVAAKSVSRIIDNHQHFVYAVSWSPDGRQLASASGDRTVKLWDVSTGEEVSCYKGHTSEVVTVAWHPDRPWIASAGFDQVVHVWDPETGERVTVLRGHSTHVAEVAWSPDGTRLASGCRDGTVKVWDIKTGKEALTLSSHASQVNRVAWSPNGMVLATAGEDHEIHLHDATPGYAAARAPQFLPTVDRRLAADSSQAADWRVRAEIAVQQKDWTQAAADLRQYLLLKPHPHWVMLDAVVAGPYPDDLHRHRGPEDVNYFNTRALNVEKPAAPASVHWKAVSNSAQGVVDFAPFMDHRDHVSGFALFPIYSPEEQPAVLLLGTDDQAVLWWNGERLYESLKSRAARPDEDAVSVKLKAGWNTLLIRVANVDGDHALFVRLSDAKDDFARFPGGTP